MRKNNLGFALFLFIPALLLPSCSDEKHTGVKVSLYDTTLYASYDFETSYSNVSYDVVGNSDLLYDWLGTSDLSSYGEIVSYDELIQGLLDNNKIDWAKFNVSENIPTSVDEVTQIFESKLPNLSTLGKITIGNESEKTLTFNNVTYSIGQNGIYSGMLPIDFEIYEYNKTNEESIGFTASSGSYSTSKNDEYFLDEVPSFKISILKEIDGKPILDESYRLEVPLTSESYSNFEITYNIVWNIELA